MKWRRSVSTVVLFAHGSNSSRFSPRNLMVAGALQQAGIGTLLFDLLSITEAQDRSKVFNIPLLARRVFLATQWLLQKSQNQVPLGYFGASTGAAAALWASVDFREVKAIVSRGGRPDLAQERLQQVKAATLLVVGSKDEDVLELNRQALKLLPSAELSVVENAGHLFEEPGTLENVATEAAAWFELHSEKKKPQRRVKR